MYTAIAQKWQEQMQYLLDFDVQLGWRRQYCGVQMLKKDGVLYYFPGQQVLLRPPYIYGLGGDEYERYGFFCRACSTLCRFWTSAPTLYMRMTGKAA